MPDFIKVNNASFSYPSPDYSGHPALSNIHLNFSEGESIALIGANGSGKSTLAKLLNCLLLPTSGQILISGLDTRDQSNHLKIRTQIGLVFQRPQDQIVATTVEEEVAFGPSNLGLSSKNICSRVDEALARTGLTNFRNRPSYLLSAGETQRLALAGILAMHPSCIIFDETTAMLDPAGRDMVMAQIKSLNKEGITTILITHLMQEAVECERVVVLNQGKIVLDNSPEHVFSSKNNLNSFGLDFPPAYQASISLSKYLPSVPPNILRGSDLLAALPSYPAKRPLQRNETIFRNPDKSEHCIEINKLSFTYLEGSPLAHQALNQFSMSVPKDAIHGLIGGTGSGKSTVLQHINGLIRPQSGSVMVDHFNLSDKDLDVQALRRKVALALQQPEDQIFEQYPGDEIAYAPRHLGYNGKLSDIVQNAMQAVGLDFQAYKDRLTSTLSGGEKRKVALASVLSIQSEILLLDEPLSGLDPASSQELIQTLSQIHHNGTTVIISTHQYEELAEILDRVNVIQNGKDELEGYSEGVFSQVDELESLSLKAPLGALISQRLSVNGWPIRKSTASISALEKQLALLRKEGLL